MRGCKRSYHVWTKKNNFQSPNLEIYSQSYHLNLNQHLCKTLNFQSNFYQGSWGWHGTKYFLSFCSSFVSHKTFPNPQQKFPGLKPNHIDNLWKTSMKSKCAPFPLLVVVTFVYICTTPSSVVLWETRYNNVLEPSHWKRPFWSKLSIRSAWSAATIFEREIEAGRYVLFFHRKTTFLVINFMSSVIRHIVQRDSAALLI